MRQAFDAEKLKRALVLRGLDTVEAAALAGVSLPTLHAALRGADLNLSTFLKIARAVSKATETDAAVGNYMPPIKSEGAGDSTVPTPSEATDDEPIAASH